MGEAQWVKKPLGFRTVRRNGVWVRPDAPTSTTTRTQARNSLVPREWTGSPGLVGSYAKEPRLDPTRYEWTKNPENGRWFARPRTELTGLNPQQTADVKSFDTQTADQSGRISAAYQALGTSAEQNAAATSKALTDLAAARGAGYSAADPTGAVLGQAARDSAVSATAPIIAGVGRTPTIARSEGATTLEQFLASRLGDRATTISGYRTAQQEAASAARDQNLKYLSDLAGNKTDLQKAQLSSDTQVTTAQIGAQSKDKDRAARLYIAAAHDERLAQIAKDRNQIDRYNALTRRAQAKRKEAKRITRSDRSAWTSRAQALRAGIQTSQRDENGNEVTGRMHFSPREAFDTLTGEGAPPRVAQQLVRAYYGVTIPVGPVGRLTQTVGF